MGGQEDLTAGFDGNPQVIRHMLMEQAMPSESQRAQLLAWTAQIADPRPQDTKPMALRGRGAAAFAKYLVWMARDEGFLAEVLPWSVVQGDRLDVPRLEMAAFVGDHGPPVNRPLWKALGGRTRILVGSRDVPGVSPLGTVLDFHLSPHLAARLAHHVEALKARR